jgi:hypothetical protein
MSAERMRAEMIRMLSTTAVLAVGAGLALASVLIVVAALMD